MSSSNWRTLVWGTFACLSLAACGSSDETTSVQPSAPTTLASASAPTTPALQPDTAPTISGTPLTAIVAGATYVFQPSAADADGDGDPLTFSASGLPAWASINAQSGLVSGVPTESDVGTTASILIMVSDGRASASLPVFQIAIATAVSSVTPPVTSPVTSPVTQPVTPPTNTAPTIAGAPATAVLATKAYLFTPTASDADGDMLAFSISGKPAWASFSTATGKLTGTPTTAQVGNYLNIVISVSDGTASVALPAFAITVSQPAPTGTASLSWTAPTQNTDGSALTDLAGYRVYHGTSPDAFTDVIQVTNPATTTYSFSQLASGTHYFAVTAYTSAGVESALSGVGSKTIP